MTRLAHRYRVPFLISAVMQVSSVILSGRVLENVRMLEGCFGAFLAYWCGAFMILHARPQVPTRGDLTYVTLAFPLMFGAVVLALHLLT